MKNIFRSELFLYLKSRTTLILFFGTILICFSSLFMMNLEGQNQMEQDTITYELFKIDIDVKLMPYQSKVGELESQVNSFRAQKDEEGLKQAEEELSVALQERNYYLLLQHTLHEINTAFRNGLNGNYYMEMIRLNEAILEKMDDDYAFYAEALGDFSREELLLENEVYQKVIEEGYIPEFNPYIINLTNYLFYLFNNLPILLITFLVMYFSVRTFTDEDNRNVYKAVYSSPYSRKEIIFPKIIVALIMPIFTVIAAILCIGLVVGIIYGVGHFDYPIAIHELGIISSKGQLIGNQILLTIVAFEASIIIVLFLSLLTNSASFTKGIAVALTVIHAIQLFDTKLLQFSPMYYLNIHNSVTLSANSLWVLLGLGGFILTLILLSLLVGSKRELREVQ